jgi:hypothetical protein
MGTTGTGTVCDSVRISPKFTLGVGWESGNPLLFADFGKESYALSTNGLEGALHGIAYNYSTGTGLITNDAGDVFTADLSGATTQSTLNAVNWTKESLSWKVGASFSWDLNGSFYGKIRDDQNTSEDVAVRNAAGQWTSYDLSFGTKLNDLYFSQEFNTLFAATDQGLGYRMGNGQEGLFPIEIGGQTNLEFHQIQGDGKGRRMAFIAGLADNKNGPCMVGELNFNKQLTPNPSVEVIDYTAPSRDPRLIESAGFFGLLGNQGLFSLFPQLYCTWPDYAEHVLGSPNVNPDSDFDSNGVSNYLEAIGGRNGIQPRIMRDSDGINHINVPLHPFLADYHLVPEASRTLDNFQEFRPLLAFPSPTGGINMLDLPDASEPEAKTNFFRFGIQRTF